MDPPPRDCRSWRRSHLDSPALFRYEMPDMEEEITRYPAVISTEEFVRGSENENWPEDSDADMEDGERFRFTLEGDEERSYD